MRRSDRTFALAVAALLAVIPLAWWGLLRAPDVRPLQPERPVRAPDAGPATPELRLGTISGHVQLRHADGGWQDADGGEALEANDGVRTGDGSSALLTGGEAWEVKMEPGTEVSLEELSASISRLLLESGMAHAQVREGARHTFEVRAAGSDAVASTDGGSFSIATNGKGTVAVATEHGEVMLTARGTVVLLRPGLRSMVLPGRAPTQPEPIPATLLLKVGFPTRAAINTPRIVIVGISEPGTLVEVMGHAVLSDEGGHFAVPILLKEGRNRLEVQARSAGGVVSTRSREVELDTTVLGPVIDPSSLWK